MIDPIGKALEKLIVPMYEDLAQPLAREVGYALGALGSFLLSPFQWFRYVSDKEKIRFKYRLEKFAAEYVRIDEADRCEIPSSIGVPATEQMILATDEDISDMFLRLLLSSASKKTIDFAHPSFVTKINSLSNDELKMIRHFSAQLPTKEIPFVFMWRAFNNKEGQKIYPRLTAIEDAVEFAYIENIDLYLTNLECLGIIVDMPSALSDKEKWYTPLHQKYEASRKAIEDEPYGDGNNYPIHFIDGYFVITDLGRMFIKACLKKLT